ncbi:EF-hand domain-containing protein [Parvibaculum sp.]|uniref:EF-hand domain-containing protein n=1 Tax=Parvibaculum sp. TaxID=2024848 RepID=UPI00320C6A94
MGGFRAELIAGFAAIALGALLPFAVQAEDSAAPATARATAHDARFKAADTNNDGVVSQAEFTAAAQKRAAERAQIAFKRIDANGDGKVTKAEYDAAGAMRRERMKARHHDGGAAKPDATAPKAE